MADTDAPTEGKPSRTDGGRLSASDSSQPSGSSDSSDSSQSTPGSVTLGELVGTTGESRTGPSTAWLFRHGMYIGAILLVGFVILPELLLSLGAGWPVGFAWALAEAFRYGAVILAGLYAVNVAVADALGR
ncbi:hypothetical protein [Haloprofundus salilacus]|uniref:hypothetical protein n=1 Tax=Haloprofundus salilacus TaxID=2876190 RepID=UPI001CC9E091|nr:hypothetical protein [Haloprofundus salilacus]